MKLSDLLGYEIESVKLEMDDRGYLRVKFSEEELGRINSYLKSEMDRTYAEWTPLWNRSVENMETYRACKIPIPDSSTKSVYPGPIARIPADQIIASVYNAIMRPKPTFSIDAYLKATYNVPTQQLAGAPNAMPVSTEPQTSELCAHRFEQGYDFIMRERVQLPRKLLRGIRDAVCGAPRWWKVVADPEQHTTFGPKSDGAVIDLKDKYENTHLRGDMVKWYLVPYTNCMMPLDMSLEEDGIDRAPWFAENTGLRPDEIAKRYAVGEFFLIKDDEEAAKLIASKRDKMDQFRARIAAETEGKSTSQPLQVCDTYLDWFYWDIKYIDPQNPTTQDGKKLWQTKRMSLLGDFHLGVGKLMSCFVNPYEHQCRPYELVDQMDEGDCTVDRLKFAQMMFTYAAHSEILAAHLANNLQIWFNPDNPDLANFFQSHATLKQGEHVPGKFEEEWGVASLSAQKYPMLELLKFYLSMSQLDSRENDFTMGGRPPGRTPSTTVAQVYQHAAETKTMMLARLSYKMARLLRFDMETRRQYQPLGETLPVWDAEAQQTVEIPFRFPVGDVLDNFRIALTAADEAMTAEKDPQQIMLKKQALMQDGEYVAKVLSAIINIQQPLPPSAVQVFTKIITRDQASMRTLMATTVSDEENYDLTREIEAVIQERNQAIMLQQAQQAAAAQQAAQTGGVNAQSAPGTPQPGAHPPAPGQGPAPGPPGAANAQPPVPAPAAPTPAAVPGTGSAQTVQ